LLPAGYATHIGLVFAARGNVNHLGFELDGFIPPVGDFECGDVAGGLAGAFGGYFQLCLADLTEGKEREQEDDMKM
jgi:hypothetical protein